MFYQIFVVLMKRLLVLNLEAFLLTVFTVFNIQCTNESTLRARSVGLDALWWSLVVGFDGFFWSLNAKLLMYSI